VAHLFIRPLQGFFHMMIFIQHKLYNIREAYPNISYCYAIGKVLKAQDEPEHIISSLDMLRIDSNDEQIQTSHTRCDKGDGQRP
jgi:hypothetical protein